MRLGNLEHDNTNLGSLLGGCRMLSAIDRGTVPVVQVIYNHHCLVSEVVIRFLYANERGRYWTDGEGRRLTIEIAIAWSELREWFVNRGKGTILYRKRHGSTKVVGCGLTFCSCKNMLLSSNVSALKTSKPA